METKQPNRIKIILAIASKDILQAINDKITLGVIIGVMLMILPSQLLPLILQNEKIPMAVIYSPDATPLSKQLSELEDTSAFQVNSLEKLQDEIASSRRPSIGLALPKGFGENVDAQTPVTIEAYLAHWTTREQSVNLVQHFETKISALTNNEVQILIIDDQVHPDENTRGLEVMFILQMINAIMTISLVLVPQLMMGEKDTHTLDALLVSPASLADIIFGKGITGCFYAILGTSIVVLMNTYIIAHWWLLLLSIVSGILFAVLLGLLIGLLFDNLQQATLWMSIFVFLIIAPAFIKLLLTVNLPQFLESIIHWLPSGQLANLVQMSLMKAVDLPTAFAGLGILWASNGLLLGLIGLQIRQQMK
jgi:ABC-2 type transport system permease protein